MAKDKKIRVHNKGLRTFELKPAKKGGKKRLLPAGRAIEIEEDLAKQLIESYPKDLVEFDSLVSGDKKDLRKENAQLESRVKTLEGECETLKKENQALKDKVAELETSEDPKPDAPVEEAKEK